MTRTLYLVRESDGAVMSASDHEGEAGDTSWQLAVACLNVIQEVSKTPSRIMDREEYERERFRMKNLVSSCERN